MSDYPKLQLRKITDEALWKEANAIAEYMFSVVRDFPESETYYSASKLRGAALNMLTYVAEALAGTVPSTTETDWSWARKAVAALRTLYPFSAKQNFIQLEPAMVVRLDKMMAMIDKE